jgi:hypothetical protein
MVHETQLQMRLGLPNGQIFRARIEFVIEGVGRDEVLSWIALAQILDDLSGYQG